jgi:DNA polymerase elongation subunit (family B)
MPNYTYNEYISNPPLLTRNKYLISPPITDKTYFHSLEAWENDFDSYSPQQVDESTYKILLYGVLQNGQKVKLIIKGVPVSFDIQIPLDFEPTDTQVAQKFATKIQSELSSNGIHMLPGCDLIAQKTANGFTEPLKWIRIRFKQLKDRVEALGILKKYNTAWDDGGKFRAPNNGYPLKYARENDVNLAGWNVLLEYEIKKEGTPTVIEINYNQIKAAPDYKQPVPAIIGYTDTEDYSSLGGGLLPNPEILGDEMFIITNSFYRPTDKNRLDNLTICHFKNHTAEQLKSMIKPSDNILITCNNEYEMLDVFITIFADVMPDMWCDFNGLDFDQKYFYYRMKLYPELFHINGETIKKYWTNNNRGTHVLTYNYAEAFKTNTLIPVSYTLLDKFFNKMELPFNTSEYRNEKSAFRYIVTKENILCKDPFTYIWIKQNIKISPDKMVYGFNIQIAGMLYIDAKPTIMKLYSKESSSSLKYFLKMMNLPEKHDMPVNAMFGLFRNASEPFIVAGQSYDLQSLIDYASWDAESIHQMFLKKSIFINNMAEAILTKTTLYDSFYRAGGMKARNLLMAQGFTGVVDYFGVLMPVAFSVKQHNGSSDEEAADTDYGGGYVLDPRYTETGRIDDPVAPLDFASLYPSITMAYNICHDTMIRNPADKEIMSKKYKLKEITFPLTTGDVTKNITVWAAQYCFDPADNNNMTPGKEWGMGVMPTILSRLKEARDSKKAEQKKIEEEINERRKQKLSTDDLDFDKNVIEGVQKAIKVQMNTFYGECGNKLSPFYFIDIAASITALGRESLRTVISIAEEKGFKVYYGDTDSVYSSAPPQIYEKIKEWHNRALAQLLSGQEIELPPLLDRPIADWAIKVTKNKLAMYPSWSITKEKTVIGQENTLHPDINNQNIDIIHRRRLLKEELYRRMTILAQHAVIGLETYVNNQLVIISSSRRLSTAYEEVLFPMALFGKKKYLGVQNIKPDCQLIGFDWMNDAHYFIRGIDFIKKGMPPIMKEIGQEIMAKCLDIMETRSIRQVVEEEIQKFSSRQWRFDSFVKTAEYKKHKKNIAVHNFVNRIEINHQKNPELYRLIEPGERFSYIYIKLNNTISKYGYRTTISAADRMQFPDVATKLGQEIDLDAYMSGTFKGLLARFISYDKEFRVAHDISIVPDEPKEPDDIDEDDDDDSGAIKTAKKEDESLTDKQAIALAQKHIAKLLKAVFNKDVVNLKDVKSKSKKHIEEILVKLPEYMRSAFSAYATFLMKVDQFNASKKPIGSFVQIISDEAKDEAKKYKYNQQYVFDCLLKINMPRKRIWELFCKKEPTIINLRHRWATSYEKTLNEKLEQMEKYIMELDVDTLPENINKFEDFVDIYNKFILLHFQKRVTGEIHIMALDYRR